MAVISPKIESIKSSTSSKLLSEEATVSDQHNDSSSANESSTSNESEIQPYPHARSEEYRQLFRLPQEEVLIQDFNCALQENFFLQGHLYLFNHNVCFYSNIFGYETKRVIPFNKITSVQRAKAAGLFPTAIEIMVGEKKIFFTSFLSRDDAFKLIIEGWSQHGKPVNMTTDILDKQSNLCSQENGDDEIGNFEKSECLQDEMEGGERLSHKDVSSVDDSRPPQDGEPECIPMSLEVENTGDEISEVENTGDEILEVDANNGSSSSSEIAPGWTITNSVAPKVSEDFTKVAEEKFKINVKEFFNLFCSDEAAGFLESFHRKCGDKDFKCSSWDHKDDSYHARDKSFLHPIKIYFGAKSGFCQESQKFRVFRDNHLVIETSQVVKDVPYADYFTVEGRWDVEQDSESTENCFLTVYMRVSFSKRTVWKVKIVQSTLDECRDVYALWIKSAHELLVKINLDKKKAGGSSSTDITLNDDGQSHQGKVGNSLEPSGSTGGEGEQQTTPNQSIGNTSPLLESSDHSLGPTVRETSLKSFLLLKSRNQVPIMVVITFALILVLMQLSIVVLLSRPQQVQVIHHHHHESDYSINSLLTSSETREQEMSAWLDKRIDRLNEDIGITETLLNKIQQDHALLKTQLSDLQNLKRQLMEK